MMVLTEIENPTPAEVAEFYFTGRVALTTAIMELYVRHRMLAVDIAALLDKAPVDVYSIVARARRTKRITGRNKRKRGAAAPAPMPPPTHDSESSVLNPQHG